MKMRLGLFALDRVHHDAIMDVSNESDACLVVERTLFTHANPDGTMAAPIHIARAMDRVVCCYPLQVAMRHGLTNVVGMWCDGVYCNLAYNNKDEVMLVEVVGH